MAAFLSYSAPVTGDHPRLAGTSLLDVIARWNDPALTVYRNRLANYVVGHLDEVTYPNIWWTSRNMEYTWALAYYGLVAASSDPVNAAAAHARAINIAEDIADNYSPTVSWAGRRHLRIISIAYDWCYSTMTQTQRDNVYEGISGTSGWVNAYMTSAQSSGEYFGGNKHAAISVAMQGCMATLNEGPTGPDDTRVVGWWETLLDECDDGTQVGVFPILRYFSQDPTAGTGDGGHIRFPGPTFDVMEFAWYWYLHLASMRYKFSLDLTTEDWWAGLGHWLLWHWRCDRTFHRQGDQNSIFRYHLYLDWALSLLASDNAANSYGSACHWLVREHEAAWLEGLSHTGGSGGVFSIGHLLFRNQLLDSPPAPTPGATYAGGNQMRVFAAPAKVVMRTGWGVNDTSMTICAPRAWFRHNQRRDPGHFDLASDGEAILVEHGHRKVDPQPYKLVTPGTTTLVPGSNVRGHYDSYYKRNVAHNGPTIFSSSEGSDSDGEKETFRVSMSAATQRVGWREDGAGTTTISNSGDSMIPKNTAQDDEEPHNLGELLDTEKAKFLKEGTLAYTAEDTNYCYAVLDLKSWFWSGKRSRVKRHFLWIKPNTLSGWVRPIILIWDDIIAPVDAQYGKRSVRGQLNYMGAVTGSIPDLDVNFARGNSVCRAVMVDPLVDGINVDGYLDSPGVEYTPVSYSSFADSSTSIDGEAHRIEYNPRTFDGSTSMLLALMPAAAPVTTWPVMTLINDGSWYGVTFPDFAFEAKMRVGDLHEAVVAPSGGGDPSIPAPRNLIATPGSSTISLVWEVFDPSSIVQGFNVYRRTKLGPATYGAWGLVFDQTNPANPTWVDNIAGGTFYQYQVFSYDVNADESLGSNITPDVEATITRPPPPQSLVCQEGDTRIDLTWTQSAQGDVTQNKIYRRLITP
jgi:hypothetical protein